MAGPEPTGRRRLSRSRHERLIFGVCGGLATYFNLDPALVRIGFVLAAIIPPLSPVSLIGYLVLTVILPEEDSADLPGRDQLRHNLDELRAEVGQLSESLRSNLRMGRGSQSRTVDVDLPEVPEVKDTSLETEERPETAEPPRPTGAVR